MWRDLVSEFPNTELHEAATEAALTDIEAHLGHQIPHSLRTLLLESDGIETDYGTELI